MCTKTAPETVAIIRDLFKVQSDHAELVHDYSARQINSDGRCNDSSGTEVVIDIFEQSGNFKGKAEPNTEKYIDRELLSQGRKRLE